MLSDSLRAVISQTLCRKIGGGRVAAQEILLGIPAISNLIREGKTFQIPSAMQIGRSQGMQTFDEALRGLLAADRIAGETAYRAAQKKEDFESFVSREFLEGKKS